MKLLFAVFLLLSITASGEAVGGTILVNVNGAILGTNLPVQAQMSIPGNCNCALANPNPDQNTNTIIGSYVKDWTFEHQAVLMNGSTIRVCNAFVV
jgi:hypothetical protein